MTNEQIERFEVQRRVAVPPARVFALLRSPQGHVRIDSTGMLQSADGPDVAKVGDRFVVHMDREPLGDIDMGRYDVTVIITAYEQDRLVEWMISGRTQPPIDHRYGYRLEPDGDDASLVTSYYDWSHILEQYRGVINFPIIPEANLRATLGILSRTLEY